jgi:hypothetical protein
MASEKKALAGVTEILRPDEEIKASIRTAHVISNTSRTNPIGLLAVTTTRLVFSGWAGKTHELNEYELSAVQSIEFERNLLQSQIVLTVSDESTTHDFAYRVEPRHGPGFITAAQRALDDVRRASELKRNNALSRQGTSTADELAKLADLHDRGALTDDEFAAAKAKVLE